MHPATPDGLVEELHDVLGHHLSLIHVQAVVALQALGHDQGRAATSLEAIATTSRRLLSEIRAAIGVLAAADQTLPRPGLGRLDDLLAEVRLTGQPVSLRTRGEPRALSGPADLAAFRVVQESLTNVRRHVGHTVPVTIMLEYRSAELILHVDDEGSPGAGGRARQPGGRGLSGLRERVQRLGGTLTAAPGHRGYRVTARLPLAAPDLPRVDRPDVRTVVMSD